MLSKTSNPLGMISIFLLSWIVKVYTIQQKSKQRAVNTKEAEYLINDGWQFVGVLSENKTVKLSSHFWQVHSICLVYPVHQGLLLDFLEYSE